MHDGSHSNHNLNDTIMTILSAKGQVQVIGISGA